MANKKIREYDAKRIICKNIDHEKIEVSARSILIEPETNLDSLNQKHGWLNNSKLVVKPDQLFGKKKET